MTTDQAVDLQVALDGSLARIRRHHRALGDRFPTVGQGTCYQLARNDNWLAGFWTGLLWLAFAATGDKALREHAEALLPTFKDRLEKRVHITHDLGFLFTLSARAQWQLTGRPGARDLALRAAEALVKRYRPAGRYIQAWGEVGDPEEGGRAIVDTMMNLPLLFWASEETSDPHFHQVARAHAETTRRYLLRPGGASHHTVFFDQESGQSIGPRTHQGYADDSLWARGQAWAIYGFALAAEWCQEHSFQEAAQRAARRFMAGLPADRVPTWDLCLPEDAPHYRDSSAGAIAASGMLRLARLEDTGTESEFYRLAMTLLEALAAGCLETLPQGQGLLRHGTYHAHKGWGVDAYFICGDYFFLEALSDVLGKAPDFWGPGGDRPQRPLALGDTTRGAESAIQGSTGMMKDCGPANTWSERMAHSVLAQHPVLARRWHYEPGVVLLGLHQVWLETGDNRYSDYLKRNIDECIGQDGSIRTYHLEDYNLDQINEGKLLFYLYETTGDQRYKKAAYLLRQQLKTQPRTTGGGFWHKQIYPHQMWLDGIYMASPFYAEFASKFDEPDIYDDVARQIIIACKHTRDPRTGLLYHAWDESKSQQWADPETGCSPNFWARAMGWCAMAIPDVLDHFPEDHVERANLLAIFQDLISGIVSVQDRDSGVWYQVVDRGGRDGNYLEASASCMFVYALAKGVRQGYLDRPALAVARRGYEGILTQFVAVDDAGLVNLDGICAVAGLGGKPYRDGSFEYYVSQKVVANEYKGVGAFILASVEMERLEQMEQMV